MKTKFLTWLSIVISFGLYAQDYSGEVSRMVNIPNSPEAEAFQEFGNTNVSLYTGTPNIAVPIYTIKGLEMDFPITLSYDATGVKVEQVASGTGLGWNLVQGGRISRIVNGKPDDFEPHSLSYLTIADQDVRDNISQYINENSNFDSKQDAIDYLNFIKDINTGYIDSQPDFYSINAPGLNDHAIFNVSDYKPYALNNSRISIEASFDQNGIISWIVRNEDGTTYYFETYEITDIDGNDFTAPTVEGGTLPYGFNMNYHSSWLLTKIESPNKKDTYELEYIDLDFWNQPQSPSPVERNVFNPDDGNSTADNYPIGYGENYEATVSYSIKQKLLSKIKHNGNIVIENEYKSRKDIDIVSALDNIKILSPKDSTSVLKIFDFKHSYFKTSVSINPETADPLDIRLKLDSIAVKSPQNQTVQKYTFEYESPYGIANRNSLGQDFLGYYNGKNSNQVLYPAFTIGNDTYEGADRSPNFEYAKRGLLNKITYPTGGYTVFDYETNQKKKTTASETETYYLSIGLNTNSPIDPSLYLNAAGLPDCDDKYYDNDSPKILIKEFIIPENDIYNLRYIPGNDHNNAEVAIVPIGDYEDCGSPICQTENLNDIYFDYCDFLTNQGDWIFSSTSSYDGTKVLNSGIYKAMLVLDESDAPPHSYGNASLSISRFEPIQITENEDLAGIRIKNITDYNNDGAFASSKLYRYTNSINDNISSGEVLINPVLSYMSNISADINGNNESSVLVNRVSSYSGGETPYIGYKKVYEIQVDASSKKNGYTEYSFNTGASGVQTIPGPAGTRFYNVDIKSGREKEMKVFTDSDSLILKQESEHKQFNLNFFPGIYSEAASELQYHYPVISLNSTSGKYTINYVAARFSCTACTSCSGGLWYLVSESFNAGECNPSSSAPSIICDDPNNECLYDPIIYAIRMRQSGGQQGMGGISLTTRTQYFNDKAVIDSTSVVYDSAVDYQVRSTTTVNSEGEEIKTEYFYPKDDTTLPGINNLIAANRLNEVIKSTTTRNGLLINTREQQYPDVPPLSNGVLLPEIIKFKKGQETNDTDIHFEYHSNGNVKESYRDDGSHTVYLWGYNAMYPVAKIENAIYSDVLATGVDLNILNSLTSNESQKITELAKLRSLAGALVTTYTYEPMVGLTSMTDPRGYRMTYEYDDFNRLKRVKDADGHIISENNYHYKGQ